MTNRFNAMIPFSSLLTFQAEKLVRRAPGKSFSLLLYCRTTFAPLKTYQGQHSSLVLLTVSEKKVLYFDAKIQLFKIHMTILSITYIFGKTLKPSILFAGNLPVLPANIILYTNTLAYLRQRKKSFI